MERALVSKLFRLGKREKKLNSKRALDVIVSASLTFYSRLVVLLKMNSILCAGMHQKTSYNFQWSSLRDVK